MLALAAGSVASWAASLALTATNGKSKQFVKKYTFISWLSTQDFCLLEQEIACKLRHESANNIIP